MVLPTKSLIRSDYLVCPSIEVAMRIIKGINLLEILSRRDWSRILILWVINSIIMSLVGVFLMQGPWLVSIFLAVTSGLIMFAIPLHYTLKYMEDKKHS